MMEDMEIDDMELERMIDMESECNELECVPADVDWPEPAPTEALPSSQKHNPVRIGTVTVPIPMKYPPGPLIKVIDDVQQISVNGTNAASSLFAFLTAHKSTKDQANILHMKGQLGGKFRINQSEVLGLIRLCRDVPDFCKFNSLTEKWPKQCRMQIDFDMKSTDGYIDITQSIIPAMQDTVMRCYPMQQGDTPSKRMVVVLNSSGMIDGGSLYKTSFTLVWPFVVNEANIHRQCAVAIRENLEQLFGSTIASAVDMSVYKGCSTRLLYNDKLDWEFCPGCRSRPKKEVNGFNCPERKCRLVRQRRVRVPFAILDINGKPAMDQINLREFLSLTVAQPETGTPITSPSAELQTNGKTAAGNNKDGCWKSISPSEPAWRVVSNIPVPGHAVPPSIDKIDSCDGIYSVRVAKGQPCFFKAYRHGCLNESVSQHTTATSKFILSIQTQVK
jgi:hypothetical protein